MIIRPLKLNETDIYYDDYNTHTIKISPYNKMIRLDEEKFLKYGNDLIINKSSSIGNILDTNKIIFNEYMSIYMDSKSGDIINYNTCLNWPYINFPYNVDRKNFSLDTMKSISQFQKYNKIDDVKLSDNHYLYSITDIFENEFQLPYLEVAGSILSFFSTINMQVPYEMMCLIDNEEGFKIQFIKTRIIYKNIILNKLNYYFTLFNILMNDIKETCEKEKVRIRIYVYVYPYGVYVKISDKDYPFKNFTYNLNNTDHHKILQINEIYNKSYYANSTLLYVLTKLNIPTVIDTLGTCIIQGD